MQVLKTSFTTRPEYEFPVVFTSPRQRPQRRLDATKLCLHPEWQKKVNRYTYQLNKNVTDRMCQNPTLPANFFEISGRGHKEWNDVAQAICRGDVKEVLKELDDLIEVLSELRIKADGNILTI